MEEYLFLFLLKVKLLYISIARSKTLNITCKERMSRQGQ